MIDKVLSLSKTQDSIIKRFTKMSAAVHDTVHCYNLIYEEKRKDIIQSSLDCFFWKMEKRAISFLVG